MNPRHKPHVAGVLLAAGASTRMEGPNKLLLDVAGEPMVRRLARILIEALAAPLVIVTGHDRAQVENALEGVEARIVHNPDHRAGQMTSVRRGLEATCEADACMVALADLVALETADVTRLMDVYARSDRARIVVPTRDGERGNPVLLPDWARREIIAGSFNFGCRNLIARNPDRVLACEMESDGYFVDVDTPDAYRALTARRNEGRPPAAPR
ncbi:MAG TPA: nucleotidyltransferase family protein [Rhodoblastus sp.]|nr:nucleotidyltransferase family protein [Rhodoblastus sp.]